MSETEHFPTSREQIAARQVRPAPDAGGEWRMECQLVKVADPPRGRVVIKDIKTLRIIACEDSPTRWDQALVDFKQIVAEHNAVPMLVAAIQAAFDSLYERSLTRKHWSIYDQKVYEQLETALTAVGRRP